MTNLTSKVLSSLSWVFTNMMAKNVLQFVRTVILWRLLSQEDFGLNGMAWLAINGFTLLQDMGFQSALIQRKGALEQAISVTWWANVVIRVVIYAILFFLAPLVAHHFHEPEVTGVLRIASLAIVIGSFGSANEALLRKNFKFKRILAVDSIELAIQVGTQVLLAWYGYGVWSLVYGTLVSVAARSLALWWLAPIKVGRFDLGVAKEMFHFGKHMTVSTLLLWLIGNMDYYFVGLFLGKAALGFYTLAFKMAFLLATNVARMLGSVLFPAFAEIGNNVGRLRLAWLKSIRYSMVLMVPMAVAMIVFSREVVLAFYKTKCEIVVLPMAILTLSALCRGVGVPLGDLQKGMGKPGLLTRVAFWHAAVMGPMLLVSTFVSGRLGTVVFGSLAGSPLARDILAYVASPVEMHLGLTLASVSVSATTAMIGLGFALRITAGTVGFSARDIIVALRPSLAAGAVMAVFGAASALALRAYVPAFGPKMALVILGPASLCVYFAVLWRAFPGVAQDLRRIVEKRRRDDGAK